MYMLGKKSTMLAAITFIGLIKYGFWTLLVVFLYRNDYFHHDPLLYTILFILHIGMIAEAYIIPQISRFTKKTLIIALAWFITNDIMDYFFGTIPVLMNNSYFSLLAVESFLISIILVIYAGKYIS